MTIEELFGTLQQSVVAGWRKHLRTAKYSKHMALNDFYEEMPDKVDALIEAWMGVNGKKIKSYDNILQSKNMNTLSYLKELRSVVKQGYALMNNEAELEAKLDDIVELIDSTLYKVKELSENKFMKNLKDFINEALVMETSANEMEWAINNMKHQGRAFSMVYPHNTSRVYVVMGMPPKADYNIIKKYLDKNGILHSDWVHDLTFSPSVSIWWNDKEFNSQSCGQALTLSAIKANEKKRIERQLKKQAGEEYPFIECQTTGAANDDWDDFKEKYGELDAKKITDYFFNMIENSEADGDSSYGRAIISIKKAEVLLKGEDDIEFISWDKFLQDNPELKI